MVAGRILDEELDLPALALNPDPLLLEARELARVLMRLLLDADPREELERALPPSSVWNRRTLL
jgi:hypothetical protein